MSQRSLMNASISVSSRLAFVGVDAHGVAGQEEVGGVAVELGALMGAEGVFDRELVQSELAGELVQLLLGRAAEVDPHRRCRALRGTRKRRRRGSPPLRGRRFGTPWSTPRPLPSSLPTEVSLPSYRWSFGRLCSVTGVSPSPVRPSLTRSADVPPRGSSPGVRPGRARPTGRVGSPRAARPRARARVGWCAAEPRAGGLAPRCKTAPGPIRHAVRAATNGGASANHADGPSPPRRRHPLGPRAGSHAHVRVSIDADRPASGEDPLRQLAVNDTRDGAG